MVSRLRSKRRGQGGMVFPVFADDKGDEGDEPGAECSAGAVTAQTRRRNDQAATGKPQRWRGLQTENVPKGALNGPHRN